MRAGASGCVILSLLLYSGAAQAASAPRLRLDLPPGPLAAAVAALSAKSGVSIGAADPRLLAIPLPALHLKGTPAALLASLARRAGVTAVPAGAQGWRIVPRATPPAVPPRGEAASTPVAAVIVQAAKRPERLEDYPAEIVRIAGADLGRYGATPDTAALTAHVPILTSTDWGAGQEKLFLRGVSDSSFTGTSPTLVGEYLGDQPLTYDAPDPDLRLYDIDSVEVMAGPQGALYGDGALGGLIRIEPNAPVANDTAGSVWAGGINTAHGGDGGDGGGEVNLPLADDRLALRVVGYAAEDPGYIRDLGQMKNDVNKTDTWGGRATLRWWLGDGWRIDLGAVAQRIDNRDAAYADAADPPYTRSAPFAQPSDNLFLAENLTVAGRIGDVDFRSTTGLVDQSLGQRYEALRVGDLSDQFDDVAQPQQLTQETRLSGATATTTWVVGASYVLGTETDTRDIGLSKAPVQIGRLHEQRSELTGYGEATQKLGHGLSATLGLRDASVGQSGEAAINASPFDILAPLRVASTVVRSRIDDGEDHLLPSAALSYQVTGQTMLFVRYGQGFRPGGLTLGVDSQRFTGDSISTLEAGVRRGVAGVDRVALTLTGAVGQWRNIQADLLDGLGMPEIVNIGNGQVSSLDASAAVRIAAGLSLSASGFLLSSRLDPTPAIAQQGAAGALPNVAQDGGAVSLDYRGMLAGARPWQAGLRVQHVGPSVLGVGPLLDRTQGDYTTVALGGGVRFGVTDVVLSVSNLFDYRGDVFAIGTPLALTQPDVTPLRPRTVRLGVRRDF
jgi:iron complex outermembrane recepter protein